MQKFRSLSGTFIVCSILVACGPSLKVSSDYDRAVDFTQYKTFALYRTDSLPSSISQLNQDRIFNAVKTEMMKKGYTESSSGPDLLVNTVAIMKDKVDLSSTTNYYGYGGAYRPYYWGGGMASGYTSYDVTHYKDGSLIIDLVDAGNKKLVWQGTGNSKIDGPVTDADTRIPGAISKIMENFPPKKGK